MQCTLQSPWTVNFQMIWSCAFGMSCTSCTFHKRDMNCTKCWAEEINVIFKALTQLFLEIACRMKCVICLLIAKIMGQHSLGIHHRAMPSAKMRKVVHEISISSHVLFSIVHADHNHLSLKAHEKRCKSRMPNLPSLVGCLTSFHATLHFHLLGVCPWTKENDF